MINNKTYKNNFFKSLDFFGLDFNFSIDGHEKFKTTSGAVLTFLYIILTIGLFFGFGVDLYQRKRPKVSNNNKIIPYEEIGLSNNNFTFAFRVEDRQAAMVQNDSVISIELTYFYYVMEDGKWKEIFSNFYPYKKCSEVNKIKEKENFYNISLESWYCIDFDNLKLGGNWDGNFVYGLLINTKQCQNSKNKKCLKDKELEENFQNELTGSNYYYSFLYMEALPEMDDFENPLKVHLTNKYEILSLKATRRLVQTYKQVTVNNDKGWFFSDMNSINIYSSDSISPDFTFKDEFTQDILYTHLVYFGNKFDVYNRSYTKIQEVIANLGGFAKIFHTCLSFVYLYLGEYLKNIFLIRRVEFDFLDEKKDENRVKEIFKTNFFEKICTDINRRDSLAKFNEKSSIDEQRNKINVQTKNFEYSKKPFKLDKDTSENKLNLNKSENNFEKLDFNKYKIKIESKRNKNSNIFDNKFSSNAKNDNISVLRLVLNDYCSCFIRKKSKSVKNYYYGNYNNFKNYFEQKFNLFNYLKICNDMDQLKNVVFEEYIYFFNKLKPNLIFKENLENSECKVKVINKDYVKIDRILNNLYFQIEKNKILLKI